jgi:hypothetical protein
MDAGFFGLDNPGTLRWIDWMPHVQYLLQYVLLVVGCSFRFKHHYQHMTSLDVWSLSTDFLSGLVLTLPPLDCRFLDINSHRRRQEHFSCSQMRWVTFNVESVVMEAGCTVEHIACCIVMYGD